MRAPTITVPFSPDYTGGAEVSVYHTNRGLIDQGVHCSLFLNSNRHPKRAAEWYDSHPCPLGEEYLRCRDSGKEK